MDLRIQSNPLLSNADRLYQQQRSQSNENTSLEEPNFLKTLMEREAAMQVAPSKESLLSLPELATLHALFGSEKPEESNFYGRNNNSQIYKGHLLDVSG